MMANQLLHLLVWTENIPSFLRPHYASSTDPRWLAGRVELLKGFPLAADEGEAMKAMILAKKMWILTSCELI